MTDRHDYVMPGTYISDDDVPAAAVPATTVPAAAVPAAVVPPAAVPAATPAVALSPGPVLDMAPPPTTDPGKIITQYAVLQEDQPPQEIITMRANVRKEHAFNDFRYLKDNLIKSFINNRVKKLSAIKAAREAKTLERRMSDHIMVLRNAGLDRVDEANAGVEKLHKGLKKMERRFATAEVLTLRNNNYELTRENYKRETDWSLLWAYNGELREKYEKVFQRALIGMSKDSRVEDWSSLN